MKKNALTLGVSARLLPIEKRYQNNLSKEKF
jgi:hypothetical protein